MWCEITDAVSLDSAAQWVESGGRLGMGVVDTMTVDQVPPVDRLIDRVLWLARRTQVDPTLLRAGVLSPACGLAGWSRQSAAEVCRTVRRAADLVDEQLDRAG